jgi:hypothetical protein
MSALPKDIEEIHPSLWRANQLARQVGRTVATGYDRLTANCPAAVSRWVRLLNGWFNKRALEKSGCWSLR